MSINFILWGATLASWAALAVQWFVLRSRYLKGLGEQRARHQHQQHTTQQQLEQAKQQIGRLQRDLNTTRLQTQPQLARERAKALQRTRAEEASTRQALPKNGFADTLPTPQFPHDASLLKH